MHSSPSRCESPRTTTSARRISAGTGAGRSRTARQGCDVTSVVARIIDITIPIHAAMPLYPGDAPPSLRRLQSIAAGDRLTASELTFGVHIGTHVDAPAHFVEDGATLDRLPLEHFMGPAVMVPIGAIGSWAIPHQRHVLVKSSNSARLAQAAFDPAYESLSAAQTAVLLRSEPLSIGFDYYSLDPADSPDCPNHLAVARRGIPVFVCLNLAGVEPGDYVFTALPLPVAGLEGCPVRAVLHRVSSPFGQSAGTTAAQLRCRSLPKRR